MKFLRSLIRGHLAPVLAGIIGLVYLLMIGFRGFGSSTLTWISEGRKLAIELGETPFAELEWSAGEQSLIDIFAAFVYLATPGVSEWVLFGLSVLAGAVATGLIFFIAQRMAGATGGWMALFFLLTCAPWMGLFTRIDPTFLLIPLLLSILVVWHSRRLSWWTRALLCPPLVALGILLWHGFLIVVALLIVVELIAPVSASPAEQPGLIAGPTINLDRLLIPIIALGLLFLYPLFGPEPLEGLLEFLLLPLEAPAAEFVFRGDAYPPDRPPVYMGAAWSFEQLPLALVGALSLGIIWAFIDRKSPDRRLVMSCAFLAVAMLFLPVFFRSPRPFGAEFTALFIATAIPLASMATCRFFSHALGRSAPSTKVRQVAIVGFLLAGVSILIEAPRAVEAPESHRSPMTARLVGWTATGDMPMREEMLPLRVIEFSGADRNTHLYSGGWEDYIEAYRRMRLLQDVETTSSPDTAEVAIRRVPPIAADRFSAYPATHIVPLPNSETVVMADIHRPYFFVDRVIED